MSAGGPQPPNVYKQDGQRLTLTRRQRVPERSTRRQGSRPVYRRRQRLPHCGGGGAVCAQNQRVANGVDLTFGPVFGGEPTVQILLNRLPKRLCQRAVLRLPQ